MKDMYSETAVVEAIAPAVYNADVAPAAVDLLGFEAALFALGIGAGGIVFTDANKIEFVMTHSDDNEDYSNVEAADVQGPASVSNGIVKALTAAHAVSDVSKIGYVGGKRYVKLFANFSGAHATGTPIAAYVVKGRPYIGQS